MIHSGQWGQMCLLYFALYSLQCIPSLINTHHAVILNQFSKTNLQKGLLSGITESHVTEGAERRGSHCISHEFLTQGGSLTAAETHEQQQTLKLSVTVAGRADSPMMKDHY